jgi:hypothetical protein
MHDGLEPYEVKKQGVLGAVNLVLPHQIASTNFGRPCPSRALTDKGVFVCRAWQLFSHPFIIHLYSVKRKGCGKNRLMFVS